MKKEKLWNTYARTYMRIHIKWRYSVVVITLDFDSNDPGSTPGTAFLLFF
jgi:hypothetical protein